MYMRWLKLHGIPTECLDWDESEIGLLKEAAFLVALPASALKSEAGVHRLTRFSPFCADNKLQTSFALVTVEPEPIKKQFTLPMHEVRIDVYRAQGPGGQGVNTTDSAVRAVHVPTGAVATCQTTRSQIKNRESALQILQQRVELAMAAPKEARRAGSGWGEAIRSYVLNGKSRVKDHRTGAEESRPQHVLDGRLDRFLKIPLPGARG